ncbi:MAG: polyprenyl synthetase family protein, partial [Methylocystis sp.]
LRLLINDRLSQLLPQGDTDLPMLHTAMSYILLAPGKRLRPLLTILTAQNFGCKVFTALDVACAVEMIHAASLILDDLPSMDNAMVRRGQKTTHRKFGEDIAILSGVGLLNLAFSVLASIKTLSPDILIKLIRLLTNAVGSDGLIGGQVMDLHLRSALTNDEQLTKVNAQKTAVLFTAAAEAGALLAGVKDSELSLVRKFASELGAGFQIADDFLDDIAYSGQTGKDTGKDMDKPTILSKIGRSDARKMMYHHLSAARAYLDKMDGNRQKLSALIDFGFSRFHSQ